MARIVGLRLLLYSAIALCALGGRASPAEPLRLVTERLLPFEDLDNDKAPGLSVEILRHVFAAMGQDVSFEDAPFNRDWKMIVRGEADGVFTTYRTREREQICSFPDEPLGQSRIVLFVRTADIGKLKFSSFDDLVGHDVAIRGPVPGMFEQPTVPLELWKFLHEHENMVEVNGTIEGLRMLVAGRVDYAVVDLSSAIGEIAANGLAGKIEPLLSRSVSEGGVYVCFSKARVAPSFVEAFSRALKQFKQTAAFQAIYSKYYPEQPPAGTR
jgi:polar amino acid transport system substrate-binding protein